MLVIGIDVAIMSITGLAAMLLVVILSAVGGLSEDEGHCAVLSCGITVIIMLLSYVVMTHVLDSMLGSMGW